MYDFVRMTFINRWFHGTALVTTSTPLSILFWTMLHCTNTVLKRSVFQYCCDFNMGIIFKLQLAKNSCKNV